MKKAKIVFLVLTFLVLFFAASALYKDELDKQSKNEKRQDINADLEGLNYGENPSDLLQVHFVDVGQGDATLITYKGHAMLIDGGDNSKGTAIQYYLKEQGIEVLDYVVATHPDADHIGGLDVILYKFHCENVLMPTVSKDTQSYEDMMLSIDEKGYEVKHPYSGEEFYMEDIKFTVLSPESNRDYEDVNDYSIVLLMEYKDIEVVFAGDAGIDIMNDILKNHKDIEADVYKVAHHGSNDSLNEAFLEELGPLYSVISCGVDNDYGHPHDEVLDYMKENDISVYRTDENGDIILYSDGTKLSWYTEKKNK